MKFQNIELYETDKFQYLLIHKNGSSSVLESIKHLNPIVTYECNFNKIRWTVIREPFERFVSGLKYDLKRHSVELKDSGFSTQDEENIMKKGAVIAFPSFWEHRVTPVTKGKRMSLIAWFVGAKFR